MHAASVSERRRFSFNDDEASFFDLSWPDAARVRRDAEAGDLAGKADGESMSPEFDRDHNALLVIGRDGVILRPRLPSRPAADQDMGPFFWCGCGIQVGDQAECLSRFVSRAVGSRLFAAVLLGPGLPWFKGPPLAVERRPLPSGERIHAEPDAAPDPAGMWAFLCVRLSAPVGLVS